MAVATYADPHRSPIAAELTGPYEEQCAVLYERLLDLVLNMALHPDEFAELWIDEDRQLAASEAALANGAITIEERPDIDLAIVEIAANEPERRGHRFAADEYVGVHPMAVNNATRLPADSSSARTPLHLHGPLRVVGAVPNPAATATGGLATTCRHALHHGRGHGLDRIESRPASPHSCRPWRNRASIGRSIVDHLIGHLRTAPAAWNPYDTPGRLVIVADDDRRAMWNANAGSWTELSRAGYDVYRDLVNTPAFFAMLPPVAGCSGLDLGCGEGHNTRLLAERGAAVVAVDIADAFVAAAAASGGRGVRFVIADGATLPFASGSFGFVTAFMSLMDVADPESTLREVQRVLEPGGFVQFSVVHPATATPIRRWVRRVGSA